MPYDGDARQFLPITKPGVESTPREKCDYLIAFLENLPPERFFMGSWVTGQRIPTPAIEHKCKTSACVGGWSGVLWGGRSWVRWARQIGLDDKPEAYVSRRPVPPDGHLFSLGHRGCDVFYATPKQAAECLRYWRDTGEWVDGQCVRQGKVDWKRAMKVAA